MFDWLARLTGRTAPPGRSVPGRAGGALRAGAKAPEPPPDVRRLVVGLGNPGPDYTDTRHNVGFRLAERVAARAGLDLTAEAARSVVAEGVWQGVPFAVATPMTFMNRSGAAYRALLQRYGLAPADVLLVYDDLSLPLGQLRMRACGGAGGHNGARDVAEALGSTEFPRLRIGIGDSFPPGGQVGYVLAPFEDDEHDAVEAALDRAAEAALAFVHDGLVAAMNTHNRR